MTADRAVISLHPLKSLDLVLYIPANYKTLSVPATYLLIISCSFSVNMFLDNMTYMKRKTNGSRNYFIVYRKQPEIVIAIFTWENFGEGYSRRLI